MIARATNALFLAALGWSLAEAAAAETIDVRARPNILLIYTDDVGFADVGCYGAVGVETPNIDRLSREGLRFTDAHCSAATCTPSRFAMLTGQYAFRQKGTGILSGSAGLIIEPGTATLPSLLRQADYTTGVVGKWHLGLGEGDVDWNRDIKPGPLEIGFDYSFLIPATGDRVPCVYLENHRVVGAEPDDPIRVSYGQRIGDAATGKERPDLLKQRWSHGHNDTIINGISRIGFMTGGTNALWVDEDMADVIAGKAVSFIEKHRNDPFFLFFSTHDIHVPRVPHDRFREKSTMGLRGDAIAQMDWCVGELLAALDRLGLADDTLVIFSSDNGPVLDDGYHDQANERIGEHQPGGPYRGGKYASFEGGTRVPLIVRWPGRIEAGSVTEALTGQIDFPASFAALTGVNLPAGACPDSQNQLSVLLGQETQGREHLVHEAWHMALRVGSWKYIPPGTTREKLGPWSKVTIPEPGYLFDLAEDPGETTDLARREPERLAAMAARLEALRSAPAPDSESVPDDDDAMPAINTGHDEPHN